MNRKSRIAALVALALVLVSVALAFVCNLRQSSRRVERFAEARQAMAAKDWTRAKQLLEDELAADANSERALAMLADVAVAEGHVPLEAYCLGRAMQLNEFESSYAARYRSALLRLRDFRRFADALSLMDASSRTSDDEAWLVYCESLVGQPEAAAKAWTVWQERFGQSQPTPVSTFLTFYRTIDGRDTADIETNLVALASSDNEAVRLESLLALAAFHTRQNQIGKADEVLTQAVELDYYAAVPVQIRHLLATDRRAEAMELNGIYLKKFPTLRRAVDQAEWLTVTGRVDELAELPSLFPVPNYSTLVFLSYLDALRAYAAGDMATLEKAISSTRSVCVTPWARLMAVLAGAASTAPDRFKTIERDYRELLALPPYLDCRTRAFDTVKALILRELAGGRAAQELAPLAAAVQESLATPDPDLARVMLVGGVQSGTVAAAHLTGELDKAPQDAQLLALAAERALADRNPVAAAAFADRLASGGSNTTVVASIRMRAALAVSESAPGDREKAVAALAAMKTCLDGASLPLDGACAWGYALRTQNPEALAYLDTVTEAAVAAEFRARYRDSLAAKESAAQRVRRLTVDSAALDAERAKRREARRVAEEAAQEAARAREERRKDN